MLLKGLDLGPILFSVREESPSERLNTSFVFIYLIAYFCQVHYLRDLLAYNNYNHDRFGI